MRQGQAALWMGLSVFVGGWLVFGSAWIGDFSWTRVVFGAIPIALGSLLMLKRAQDIPTAEQIIATSVDDHMPKVNEGFDRLETKLVEAKTQIIKWVVGTGIAVGALVVGSTAFLIYVMA